MKLEEIKKRFEEDYSRNHTVVSYLIPRLNRSYEKKKEIEWLNVVNVCKKLNIIDF